MKTLNIFKAGTHTSAGGATLAFGEDDLQATAANYNPELHEAPIVVGHPKHDLPAYGWISSLAFTENGLEAEPAQVDAEFQEMVAAGRFKKISASFYTPDSPSNPVPGTYYLRHVGFLGAQPPAVKGLRDASFNEAEEGVIEFADNYTTGILATLFRRFREYVIGKDGLEEADKLVPDYLIQDLEAEARRPMDEPATAAGFSETPQDETGSESTMTKEEIEAAQAELEAQRAAFAEEQNKLATERQAMVHQANAAYIDGLAADGKVVPAQKDALVAFMDGLSDDETVSFGEGDEAAEKGRLSLFKEILEAQPARVDFGERSKDDEAGAPTEISPEELAAKAVEYQEAQAEKGITVTTSAAVAHIKANL